MGDRANIQVKENDNDPGVFLYSHWGGTEIPFKLKIALSKRWRWDDSAYLTRIIFDTMTEGQHGEETGFGISTEIQDGHTRVLTVNVKNQTVSFGRSIWTFTEYLAIPYPNEDTWEYGE